MHETTIAQRAAYQAATDGRYDDARAHWLVAAAWYLHHGKPGGRRYRYGEGCQTLGHAPDAELPRYQTQPYRPTR